MRPLVEELDAGGFLFAGDDLGDVEAFEAVADAARATGMPDAAGLLGLRRGERACAELADVVVDGPDGVLDLLRQLTADVRGRPRAEPALRGAPTAVSACAGLDVHIAETAA